MTWCIRIGFLAFPMSRRAHAPVVTTLHGRLDLPELQPIFKEYSEMPVVSISNAQRKPLPGANWAGTVYHGIPGLGTDMRWFLSGISRSDFAGEVPGSCD